MVGVAADMRVVAITAEYAADIISWRYPAPYDCYDVGDVSPGFMLDPGNEFFALVSGSGSGPGPGPGELIGFRSFGADGRVPGGEYDDSALDTGGGLRPSLTGQGLGRQAIQTGLEFGRRRFAPPAFRVTVASFNVRALRVVTSLGFRPVSSFAATTDGRRFEILIRPEAALRRPPPSWPLLAARDRPSRRIRHFTSHPFGSEPDHEAF
jgi:[ribosomal protein S18]-alanine N-acetyltransferase